MKKIIEELDKWIVQSLKDSSRYRLEADKEDNELLQETYMKMSIHKGGLAEGVKIAKMILKDKLQEKGEDK